MRVAVVTSLCVDFDAISAVARRSARWAAEAGHEVVLFAQRATVNGLDVREVSTAADLALDPWFRSADVVLMHLGIYYPPFDALAAAPPGARTVVRFHNITPKRLLPSWQHDLIDRSLRQAALMRFADEVHCDSELNLRELRAIGVRTPAVVRPLAVDVPLVPPQTKPSADDGVLRLAFVGRFVRAKGAAELVEALARALPEIPQEHVEVDLVGNVDFSDAAYLRDVRAAAGAAERAGGGRLRVRVHGNAPDEQRDALLRAADLFVLPTYHEGFCVPVVEAFASGCRVIAYDNSNLPDIGGGLATLVPTADVDALAAAVVEEAVRLHDPDWVTSGYAAYREELVGYVSRFDAATIRAQFLADLDRLGRRGPAPTA